MAREKIRIGAMMSSPPLSIRFGKLIWGAVQLLGAIWVRWSKGVCRDDICVRVHVEENMQQAALDADNVIAKAINGVTIDVISGPYCVKREMGFGLGAAVGSLRPEDACKRRSVVTGSVSAIAVDNKTDRPGVPSGWHVTATHMP